MRINFFEATKQTACIFSKGEETGVNYYGARYLDPKYSRWLSRDPALGDYIPKAPIDDEAKKHNENLPGMGGVYNTVNLHLYHYAGNNPVKYTDPDGKMAWTSSMWWLTAIDGPLPAGDLVYFVGASLEFISLYYATSKSIAQEKSISKAATIANEKNKQGFTSIVIQIQQNLKGNSNKTLGTSGPVIGAPDSGVTKKEALKGLEKAIADLSTAGRGNGGMVKSPDFQKALHRMRERIKTTAPLPHRKNALQERFEYKGVEYRIDLDSYIFDSKAQNLAE